MRNTFLLTLIFLGLSAGFAHADSFVQVSMNTASIAGTTGSLDFQFNYGTGETQAATVKIMNLTGGTNGASSTIGTVSGGPLPTPVTIGNGYPGVALNDYFEGFTYGNSISFLLDFSGPAVTAPNGLSIGNSVFYFSTYSDANGTVPVLTSDPNGVAATVTVNPAGTLTTAAVSPNLRFTPEPGSFWLLGASSALLGGIQFLRRKAALNR